MRIILIVIALILAVGQRAHADNKLEATKPDLDLIKKESIDPKSKYYYPRLLKEFMSNDTAMVHDEYVYFYYGTLFQEDYDPYRPAYDEAKLKEIEPLYYQTKHTNQEIELMREFAKRSLEDNPLDLVQIKNLVYTYESRGKIHLAKIWKNKLNHLLRTIASSGTGVDTDSAWYIVFPRHEFDLLNISGRTVQSREFMPPYYEKVEVSAKSEKDAPTTYYFNLQPVLEQYYLKHPSEAN